MVEDLMRISCYLSCVCVWGGGMGVGGRGGGGGEGDLGFVPVNEK